MRNEIHLFFYVRNALLAIVGATLAVIQWHTCNSDRIAPFCTQIRFETDRDITSITKNVQFIILFLRLLINFVCEYSVENICLHANYPNSKRTTYYLTIPL